MDDIRVLVPVVDAHPHLSRLSVCHFVDPSGGQKTHLSESAETSQDTSSDPCRVLALRRRKDLYPHVLDGQPLQFREQTVTEALGQRAASREHNVAVQRLAQVEIRPVDRVDDDLVHARVLEADDLGVEKNFWCPEAFRANLASRLALFVPSLNPFPDGKYCSVAYLELVTVRQNILHALGRVRPVGPLLLLLPGIVRDVGDGLLDEPHDLLLGAGVKDVAALAQQRLHVLRHIAARDVYPPDATRHREALVHRDGVRHAVARVKDDTRRPAAGV